MTAITSAPKFTHVESLALHAHLCDCRRVQGLAFGLQCLGEQLHGVLGPRPVTTVLAAVTLIALLGCA